MAIEIIEALWFAIARKIFTGRAEDAAHRADASRIERRIGKLPDPHAEIYPFVDVGHHAIEEHEIDVHRWLLHQKGRNDRQYVQAPEDDGRGDRQLALGNDAFALDRLLQLVVIREKSLGLLEIAFARVRERDGARGAIEQLNRRIAPRAPQWRASSRPGDRASLRAAPTKLPCSATATKAAMRSSRSIWIVPQGAIVNCIIV